MALTERFRGFTVASALTTRATSDPQRDFLLHGDAVLTYGQVESQSEALAAALAHLGVEAGDRVALVLPACPEFVISMLAAAKLGAVIVPLNPRLPTAELQYMLRHSEAVCAVTVEHAYGVDYLQLFEEMLVQLPELQYLVTVGEEDLWYDVRIFQFSDLLSAGGGRDFGDLETGSPERLFAIVYTSGTTGKPKGVELSHSNLISVAAGTADALELSSEDRVIGVAALFHVFGLGPGVLSTLLAGASIVLQDEPDPNATLELIEKHRATVHYGVPTIFVGELQEVEREPRDVSSLRIAMVAGAPVGDSLMRRIRERICPLAVVA